MTEHDMQVFLDVGVHYFEKITGERAQLGSARLQFGRTELSDFTGVIRISGSSAGVVCMSVPTAMVDEMLNSAGESLCNDEMERDMIGEAASIIASNARKHFGPRFEIATPETYSHAESAAIRFPFARFAIPIAWKTHHGSLILALSETDPVSPNSENTPTSS